ncbi:MAG TPA: SidA/IucD/PvdA family monooxygenase [Terrimicrobiaceae bacterium]
MQRFQEPHCDILGIGIGPFNLGLAALCQPITSLKALFVDKRPEFNWHAGMLLYGAKLQVPYLADLVTLVDPCSPFSFINYMHKTERLFHFCIKEDIFISRREYNDYCRWVATQLPSCRFGNQLQSIRFRKADQIYEADLRESTGKTTTVTTKKIVLGIGSTPNLPYFCSELPADKVFHSAEYTIRRETIRAGTSVTVVGSGQSAAEIFHDLLGRIQTDDLQLNWISRSDRFYPMEYSKLTLELTSPDYVDYFYGLTAARKSRVLAGQSNFYRGINFDLINTIYDELYSLSIGGESIPVTIRPACEVLDIRREGDRFILSLQEVHQGRSFEQATDIVILATGYKYEVPAFLDPIRERIRWDQHERFDVHRNYAIDHAGTEIFVQNAELHTHGFVAPDLGMGPYRNAWILKEILGFEYYPISKRIAFQSFGAPGEPSAQELEPLITESAK